jgi:hypothetical protein
MWSYTTLNRREQAALRQLTVFAGGCALDAARAVIDLADDAAALPAALASLVARQLVRAETVADGTARFRLPDVVREFAADVAVAEGDAAAARDRHATFFRDLAEMTDPALRGTEQRRALDRLARDDDNLRAALGWSIAVGEADTALRLAGALWHFWELRLIAPGWYGIANVKWLTRIEVRDQRYEGNFMAREYVTMRQEERDGETVWTFSSVGHDRLKSAPAKVTQQGGDYAIMGAAWGAPIASVEVSIDQGPWRPATLLAHDQASPFTWSFWTFDWGAPAPGEHAIASRAIAADGAVQPAPDDPLLAGKKTYWESNGQITRRVRIA